HRLGSIRGAVEEWVGIGAGASAAEALHVLAPLPVEPRIAMVRPATVGRRALARGDGVAAGGRAFGHVGVVRDLIVPDEMSPIEWDSPARADALDERHALLVERGRVAAGIARHADMLDPDGSGIVTVVPRVPRRVRLVDELTHPRSIGVDDVMDRLPSIVLQR